MTKGYGILIKDIRLAHDENMGDMAKWLGVSLPFVSAVENGKKKIPDDWEEKIAAHYQLSLAERKELKEAILETQKQVTFSLLNVSASQKRMVLQFQRSFENIDDETAEKICRILEEEEK
mgnify:FL=1